MTQIITPDGAVATTQGGTVYVKAYGDFSRFVWGGECVYIGDITDERGGLSVTTRADAREGGLRRDGVLVEAPGTVSTTLSMKRIMQDKLKSRLRSCFWLFDKRTQCRDFDSPQAWTEIERVYRGKVGTRTTTPGTAIMYANAEDMVNFDITALEDWDIYRIHLEEKAPTIGQGALLVKCVDVCHGERCVACGDPETDAVLVAGTQDDGSGSSPYILVNVDGGDPEAWTGIEITEWNANDIDGITCLGTWGAAVSNGAGEVLYSRDRFATNVFIDSVAYPDFVTGPPNAIDAASQAFCVIAGGAGYIYLTRDGFGTLTTSLAGSIVTDDLTGIRIAPSNRQVVYAWSSAAADVLLKTENGCDTWFQLPGTLSGDNITALAIHPDNAQLLLVGTDAGDIYQSEDGGETFTIQAALPGTIVPGAATITDLAAAGGGVWFAAVNETDEQNYVYVNYEDGASGAWEYYNPLDGHEYATATPILALGAVNPNRCVAVGGDGTAAALVALLA